MRLNSDELYCWFCCISVLLCVFIFTRNVSGLQGLCVVVGAVGVLVPVGIDF